MGNPEPNPPLVDPDCAAAGFVLAGGQSSRMGPDKALLRFAGRPLVEHALSILREAGLPVSIAGANPSSRSSLAAYAPIIEDAEPGLGPLAGVCAALASTSARRAVFPARHAVFLPIDLPLLPPSLLVFLLHHAGITGRAVTVPTVSGFTQTFPAVLDRTLLPALQNELEGRRAGCFSAFQAAADGLDQAISAVAVEFLAQSGQVTHPLGLPPVHWFLNLNSPADLERAEALLAHAIA
ncbi:MAG: NTP transferase domain-containing protein [Terracidiphilus sp.]